MEQKFSPLLYTCGVKALDRESDPDGNSETYSLTAVTGHDRQLNFILLGCRYKKIGVLLKCVGQEVNGGTLNW